MTEQSDHNSNLSFHQFDDASFTELVPKTELVSFLYNELGSFGDDVQSIEKALDYAIDKSRGGTVFLAMDGKNPVGAAITNNTHMQGYIPGNILVYIAVSAKCRGKGVGKTMMNNIIATTKGDICLHVEAGNPAKRLYERLGFSPDYVEMRYKPAKNNNNEQPE